MTWTYRMFVVLFALALAVPALAQQPPQEPAPQEPPAAQEPAAQEEMAEGQLLRVDPDAQTLAIQAADGSEQEFRYDDQTQVEGAEEGVAGLATKTGSQVTIHFTAEEAEQAPLATRIEVAGGM